MVGRTSGEWLSLNTYFQSLVQKTLFFILEFIWRLSVKQRSVNDLHILASRNPKAREDWCWSQYPLPSCWTTCFTWSSCLSFQGKPISQIYTWTLWYNRKLALLSEAAHRCIQLAPLKSHFYLHSKIQRFKRSLPRSGSISGRIS